MLFQTLHTTTRTYLSPLTKTKFTIRDQDKPSRHHRFHLRPSCINDLSFQKYSRIDIPRWSSHPFARLFSSSQRFTKEISTQDLRVNGFWKSLSIIKNVISMEQNRFSRRTAYRCSCYQLSWWDRIELTCWMYRWKVEEGYGARKESYLIWFGSACRGFAMAQRKY